MAVYKWTLGSRVKCDAQKVGEQCEHLAQDGNLTPKALVDANRDIDAPLHSFFEWNDEIAAEKYRETQAAYVIRSIEVDIVGSAEPTRAFVSLEISDGSHREYRSIETVMQDRNSRERLLELARRDMETFKWKYADLQELAGVFAAMDEFAA